MIDNTATMVFFPNPTARPESFNRLNLIEEQKSFICGDTPRNRQALVVRRDSATGLDESVIINLDLSYLKKVTRFYKSGAEPLLQLAWAKETAPTTWFDLL